MARRPLGNPPYRHMAREDSSEQHPTESGKQPSPPPIQTNWICVEFVTASLFHDRKIIVAAVLDPGHRCNRIDCQQLTPPEPGPAAGCLDSPPPEVEVGWGSLILLYTILTTFSVLQLHLRRPRSYASPQFLCRITVGRNSIFDKFYLFSFPLKDERNRIIE